MNWSVLMAALGVNLTSANHATMILAILPVLTGAIAMFWDRSRPKLTWLILSENLSLLFLFASSIIMLSVLLAFRAR